MVTFIHFSDTHLGYSNIENQDENGNNIREYDFYNSFKSIVDDIIKLKPDFVIHSGDLFHRSTPSNKSIVFANSQINRLSVEGIPFFIIAGNHDLPKSIFTGQGLKHLWHTVQCAATSSNISQWRIEIPRRVCSSYKKASISNEVAKILSRGL